MALLVSVSAISPWFGSTFCLKRSNAYRCAPVPRGGVGGAYEISRWPVDDRSAPPPDFRSTPGTLATPQCSQHLSPPPPE